MADVRSMLRAERNARRVDHEDAHYTPGGMLMCKVCELLMKSDALWAKHIQSKHHRLQLQRRKDNPIPAPNNKKRKAVDEEESERKKSRAEETQASTEEKPGTEETAVETHQGDDQDVDVSSADQQIAAVSKIEPDAAIAKVMSHKDRQADTVDEEEWAAFEREVATPPPEVVPLTALNATATIEAAPMSAEEIAARAREEANAQRGPRDEEVEAEKEDAARQLEDEFDEMENYEERVRKLKEKREALRTERMDTKVPIPDEEPEHAPTNGNSDEDSADDDDSYDDSWDGWHMRVT
ncbi:MAG: hypothetical protein M1822_008706 [Bathelium mastoideum]|nr:MAG: hypothetical protein M1822_008706 [Bathelium mastoideum]